MAHWQPTVLTPPRIREPKNQGRGQVSGKSIKANIWNRGKTGSSIQLKIVVLKYIFKPYKHFMILQDNHTLLVDTMYIDCAAEKLRLCSELYFLHDRVTGWHFLFL